MNRSRVLLGSCLLVAASAVIGCQGAPSRESTVVQLKPLNSSGVTGTVTLTDVGDGRIVVDVEVDPDGNLDMPAHIHPGSCDALIPQPVHPLENVVNGSSITTVRATLEELTGGGLAVNLHRSNDDLGTYTACAEL
jgi:hypothetical protein